MTQHCVFRLLLAALALAGSARLSAQDNGPANQPVLLIPDGETVYDTINHITWLADANLAAEGVPGTLNFRFGLPLCDISSTGPAELPDPCVNASGSMNYASAVAWVKGMNDAGYLGHSDWQLPTTWKTDTSPSCPKKGANGDSFAFGCYGNALGYLYYKALGLKAPNTAVPIPPNTVGPFSNFQPYFYWSRSGGGGLPADTAVFSFNSGSQGGATTGNFMYVLPMIEGELRGSLPICCRGLYVYPGGQAVYDIDTDVTWLADANLAADWLPDADPPMDTLGMPRCKTAPDTTPCVALDGSMNYESATEFILKMNKYDHGAGYLGQTNWKLPTLDASCPSFGCGGDRNPMGNLYYEQLKFSVGIPIVATPDIAVGPFQHIQPYLYWSCQASKIQDACAAADSSLTAEWGFSFGNGFLGTERLEAEYYVIAYYVGCDPGQSWCQAITFPPITATENALSSLALSATATSGLAVTFTSTTPKVCTVSGVIASLLRAGNCTIEASQAGNESFVSALPVQQTFTVHHAEQTITFPQIKTQKVGADVHLHATASSGLKVTFSGGPSQVKSLSTIVPVCMVQGDSAVMLKVGVCTITAHQAGNDIYAPAPDVVLSVGVE